MTPSPFATADGLQVSNGEASGPGWWNKNGGDIKLFKAMLGVIPYEEKLSGPVAIMAFQGDSDTFV